MLFIVLAAVGTTGYTLIDSRLMHLLRESTHLGDFESAVVFLPLLEFSIALVCVPLVFLNKREYAAFRQLFFRSWAPHLAGVFSSSAYILILVSMMYVTNVSYVQAFRQMSLPVGVLMGFLFLGEKHGAFKLAGIALIAAGLVMAAAGA